MQQNQTENKTNNNNTKVFKELEDSSSFASKINEMFLLQKKLNDNTNGLNWELCVNKFGKEINWLRCIHMEVAELIESTPWKHWKNISSDSDLENIKIELVDIWHFIMSYLLQETNIPQAVKLTNDLCRYEVDPKDSVDIASLVTASEQLSFISLSIQTGNTSSQATNEMLISQFFKTCKIAGLSFSTLQKMYIGKNCLNKFRQDNGYKEGTYKKIWIYSNVSEEDNVAMMKIIERSENISFDAVYQELETVYKSTK